MADPREYLLAEIHERLGYHRLNLWWAKAEIVLGLVAVAVGLWLIVRLGAEVYAVVGVLLFVLGGYLTLAGHRSHLYKADNERLVLLVEEIRRMGTDTQVSPQRR